VPDGADEFVDVSHASPTPSVVGAVERMTGITWAVKSTPFEGESPIVHGRVDIFWWADVSEHEGGHGMAGMREAITEADFAAVVHDKQAGKIHHIHEEIALPGAEPPDRTGLQRRALALASAEADTNLGDVTTLVVPAHELRVERLLRVDVKRRRLVDVPR
jgi:hypothetical protein